MSFYFIPFDNFFIWDTDINQLVQDYKKTNLAFILRYEEEELLNKLMNNSFNYKECLFNYLVFKSSLQKNYSDLLKASHVGAFSTHTESFKKFIQQTFPEMKLPTSQYEPEISDKKPVDETALSKSPIPGYLLSKQSQKKNLSPLQQFYNKIKSFGSQAGSIFKSWWSQRK